MNPNFKSITFNLEELEFLYKTLSEHLLDEFTDAKTEYIWYKLCAKFYVKKVELEVQKKELEKNVKRS